MSEKKKALIVTTVSGFVPQFEMNNVKILQDKGYEVHYAANYNMPVYTDNNDRLDGTGIIRHQVDFVRSPLRLLKNIKAYKQLKRIMEYEKFDLMHCHTPMGGVLGRIAAYRVGISNVIYTAHGFHFFKGAPLINWLLFYPIEYILAKFTDVIITINKEDYVAANRFKLKSDGRVYYVAGVGVDIKKFSDYASVSPNSEDESFRDKFSISKDTFLICSVGEISKRKNQKIVVEAMAKITDINIKYIICGSGKEEERLKEMVRKNHLESKVIFTGYQQDINSVLHSVDCFVFPSLQEGLPVALIEAMAVGLPIICSNIRGNIELIENFKGGIIVKNSNKDNYAEAIQKIYNSNPEELGIMKNINLAKAKEYSIKIVEQKMRGIYEKI